MNRVRLNPSFSVVQTATGALLRSDLGTFHLHGSDAKLFVNAILPLLDRDLDQNAIADALQGYPRRSIFSLLDRLAQCGIVEIPDAFVDDRWRGQIEFFRKWTDRPEALVERLRRARILVVGLEPWGAAAAIELAASGIGTLRLVDNGRVQQNDLFAVRSWGTNHLNKPRGEALTDVISNAFPWCQAIATPLFISEKNVLVLDETKWDLVIGAGTRDEFKLFYSLARFAHVHNIPSLFGSIHGLEAIIGPAVAPGRTACWNCARLRQLANSAHAEIDHALNAALRFENPKQCIHTHLSPMAPLVGHLLALEALKLVSEYTTSRVASRILVQHLITLETTFHTLIRMPWCEVCGGSSSAGGPVGGPVLEHPSVGSGGSTPRGLDNFADPGELHQVMEGWIDPRTGVIQHLGYVTSEVVEPDLPIVCSATVSSYADGVSPPLESYNASGKGLTLSEAMIGAVGEALERYSAARSPTNLLRAALNDMDEDAVDPRDLCLYSDAQYVRRGFPFVRFDPSRPITWAKGWWLDTGQPVWIPALLTYLDLSTSADEMFCQVTSNGLAAGASIEDATLRAVLELVERDSFMISWLARLPGRRLLLDDTLDAGAREAVRQFDECGLQSEIFVLDAGLGIPVIACVGLGDGTTWPGLVVGLGAHPSTREATRKAILEMGATARYVSRLISDPAQRIPNKANQVRTITDHALYYAPARRADAIAFLRCGGTNSLPLSEFAQSEDLSLEACILRLKAGGVRVAAVDVSSPDVLGTPFRVVRALGIGMQPLDFGYLLRREATPRLKASLVDGLSQEPHPLA